MHDISSAKRLDLHRGNMFKYKGYIKKENVRWIAAQVYKDQKPYYGYLVVPEEVYRTYPKNNSYYSLSSNFPWSDITHKRDQAFITELNRNGLQLKLAEGGLKMQAITESNNNFVVIKYADRLYYCDKQFEPVVKAIRSKFYGNTEREDEIFSVYE